MHTKYRLVLGFAAIIAASAASAGVGSSGGGKAVVCRDALSGSIQTAELLDLYEATARYGLTVRPDSGNMGTEYSRTLDEIRRIVDERVPNAAAADLGFLEYEMEQAFRFLPWGEAPS